MDVALSSFDAEARRRLAAGLVFSVLAHLVLGLSLIGERLGAGTNPLVSAALTPPESERPEVRPGIERSNAVNITWLGFETPTEHRATPADSEQAALSPDQAGDPEALETPETSVAESAPPQPESLPDEAAMEVAASPPTPDSAPPPVPAPSPTPQLTEATRAPGAPVTAPELQAAAPPPLLAVPTEDPALPSSPFMEIVRRTVDALGAAGSMPEAAPPAEESAAATPPTAPPVTAGRPGERRDALPSEKESTATSKDQPIDWFPGRPLAAEGLDVTTVDPRWNITTRLSALPRNPVVRIEFGRDGKVKKAAFVPGEDTGSIAVDGPLMDALYRWTAKGRALAELPAGDPEATVSFRIRIVLIPSRGTVRRASDGR